MFTIAKLAIALATAQLGEMKAHTGRKVAYLGALAFFGLLVLIFGLIAATVALTERFGQLHALLIMAGVALLGCIVVLILMKIAERKHQRIVLEREEMRGRLKQLALMTALGGTTTGRPGLAKMAGLGVVGLATLLAVNNARRNKRDD